MIKQRSNRLNQNRNNKMAHILIDILYFLMYNEINKVCAINLH
jgi:hypothetical protein